jgi:hypothetical protein
MAIVYQHKRKDTNEVFYVGIGKSNKRAYCKIKRNAHWYNIVNKIGYDIEILYENISWEEACEKEVELIKKYGRMDLKHGSLVNMSDGGDGLHNPSQETKKKMSEAKKGHKQSEEHIKNVSKALLNHIGYWKGKTRSDETKKKISEAAKMMPYETKNKMSESKKRKVSTLNGEIVFESGRAAAKHYGVNPATISNWIKNNKNVQYHIDNKFQN